MSSTMMTWRPAQLGVEVLDDADDAAGLGGRPVARHRHEVDLDGQVDGPGQVGEERERALEDAHEQRRPVGVVGGDLGAELGDPRLELLAGDDDLAEAADRRSPRRRDATGRPEPARLGAAGAVPAHGEAAADLGADRLAAGHGEDPLDGGELGRVVLVVGVGAQPGPQRPAGERPAAPRPAARASVGSGTRLGGERVEQRRASSAARSASRHSSGTTSRSATSSSSGSTSWRTRLRRNRGSSLVGSRTGVEAEVGAERRGSRPDAGRRSGGRVPGRRRGEAVEPGAPQHGEQHGLGPVVGGVAGGVARRAARPGGRPGPGPRGRARRRRPPARRGTRRRSGWRRRPRPRPRPPSPARRPWSTCTAVTSHPAAHGEDQQGEGVGARRTRRTSAPSPRAGTQQRSRSGSSGIDAAQSTTRPARTWSSSSVDGVDVEAAGDAAEAGVDVRPAHPEARRRRPAPSVIARIACEQLLLLVGELADGRRRGRASAAAAVAVRRPRALSSPVSRGRGRRRSRRPAAPSRPLDAGEVLEGPLLGPPPLDRLGARRRAPRHGVAQLVGRDRLGEVAHRALDAALGPVQRRRQGGEHDDGDLPHLVVGVGLERRRGCPSRTPRASSRRGR